MSFQSVTDLTEERGSQQSSQLPPQQRKSDSGCEGILPDYRDLQSNLVAYSYYSKVNEKAVYRCNVVPIGPQDRGGNRAHHTNLFSKECNQNGTRRKAGRKGVIFSCNQCHGVYVSDTATTLNPCGLCLLVVTTL